VLDHEAQHRVRPRIVHAIVDRPLHRAVHQPQPPPFERLVRRPPKIPRAGLFAQLVERLDALAHAGRGLFDDAGHGELVDEGALHMRQDRVGARLLVAIGQEVEQRIILGNVEFLEGNPRGRLPRNLALVDEAGRIGGARWFAGYAGGGRCGHSPRGDCTDFPSRKISPCRWREGGPKAQPQSRGTEGRAERAGPRQGHRR